MKKSKTEFISVEICIKTNQDCDEFVKWFSKDHCVEKIAWESHKWFVYFAPMGYKNPDKTIQKLCEEIKNWPKKVRKEWEQAEVREFYVGYQLGEANEFFDDTFTAKTISLVNKQKAAIKFALYQP